MGLYNTSSPQFLREMGVNRRWPTSPFMVLDTRAAAVTGHLTNMSNGTQYGSSQDRQQTDLARFRAIGAKMSIEVADNG